MYYIFICKFKYAGVCVIAIHYISKKLFCFSLATECLIYFYLLISNTNSDGEERHIVQL